MKLINNTPYAHDTAVFYDCRGGEAWVVAVKASFQLSSTVATRHPTPIPVYATDQRFPSGATRYPSDLVLDHLGTDVVCVGTVYAPGAKAVATCDARLNVAGRAHTVRTFGRREWRRDGNGYRASAPTPFVALPIGFEHAYGGTGVDENPIGTGAWDHTSGKSPVGIELPSFEDPTALIKQPDDRPRPTGFGAVAPNWQPRRGFAGTYDKAWATSRAPILPTDFDPRFFGVALPSLSFPEGLRGGEELLLVNLTPAGSLTTAVPRVAIRIAVDGKWVIPNLDVLLLEPDEDRISLTFRHTVDVTGRCDQLPELRIFAPQLMPLGERATSQ